MRMRVLTKTSKGKLLAIANEVNKVLKKDKAKLLIGAIAPDISKLIGEDKTKSHFLVDDTNIPNIEQFLKKYKDKLHDDFVMGYYIHLYTDYLWFKYFINEIINKDIITKKDGSKVKLNGKMKDIYIYNDYTNLNIQLIEKYGLDLKIFYNFIPDIENIIDEIPMANLNLLMDKAGLIIANSKKSKDMVFDISDVCKFIETSVKLILSKVLEENN